MLALLDILRQGLMWLCLVVGVAIFLCALATALTDDTKGE